MARGQTAVGRCAPVQACAGTTEEVTLSVRRGIVAGSLVMVLGLAAACGSSSPSTQDNTDTITYGLPTSVIDITTVGIEFAIDQGYFAAQHITVNVKPLNGGTTAIRAALSGDVDIAQTGADTAALAVQSGATLKIISSPVTKQPGVIIGNAPIKTLADLKGHTYAISAPGSSGATQIAATLTKAGIDPASVKLVAIGAPDARVRAMIEGKVDATSGTILILQPALDAIAQGKMNILSRDADNFPDLPLSVDIVTENMTKQKHDLLVRFVTAELKGYRWAQDHPEDAAKVAAKYITTTSPDLLATGMKQLSDLHAYGLNGITGDGISRTVAQLQSLGTLKSTVDTAVLADPTVTADALKVLGNAS